MRRKALSSSPWRFATIGSVLALHSLQAHSQPIATDPNQFEQPETRALVELVNDATELVATRGEAAFDEFRVDGSRWRQGETYVFVLDARGNTLVHADPAFEGSHEIDTKDINGKPIIRGMMAAAASDKGQGWYHYEWAVPGAILPRWKSTFLRSVQAPSGQRFVVAAGMYNDRMERPFVIDMVSAAVDAIETSGADAYPLLRDPTGPFLAKDAYVFVIDMNGIDRVNPAFPNLEGRNLLDLTDTEGKHLVREMLEVAQTTGSGWVEYLWPKPGDSLSTLKSTYVSRANVGGEWVVVGSGVYLADAPKESRTRVPRTAPELMALVRDGAALLGAQGERAFAEFRKKGSKWFPDDTYFFVWTAEGHRVFHAADPSIEGQDVRGEKDVLGRPYGEMFLDVAASPSGEGWVHYMYPEPGDIFPTWKSAFLKRVVLPSGKTHLIGAGIYNMAMDQTFIEDVVGSAAALISERGTAAFEALRDPTGPFVFMDTYVFVDSPDGVELVNPAQPSLEGQNIVGLEDVNGRAVAREYIAAAMKNGSAWVDYYWYRPGENITARKRAYVQRVQSGDDVYVVGSGLYVD
jgi:signal transduction histidine kinase